MSDEQWLRAVAKYDAEDGRTRGPDFFLQGGAHQLSGELEVEVRRDPERFARLAPRFPANTHPYYFHAVLRALKDSPVPKDLAFDVVRAVFHLPTKPGGRYLCDPVTRFSDEEIPDDIMAIIGWLATEAEDPKTEELKIHRANGTEEDQPNEILTTAINSVRGTAAEAVGTLLFDNAARIPFLMPYLHRMVEDPTVIVRTTAAHALLCLYRHDETSAVDLFLDLADVDADVLFATHHVDRFLYYANICHFARLRPILRRMLDSDLSVVREAGARHACLAQFSNPGAKDLVDECLTGDEAKRKGAVRVAEANVFQSDCREFSHPALVRFFSDSVKEIRDEAATCFRLATGRQLETCRELIRSFLKSPAFVENVEKLTWPLEHSTADIGEEIVEACEAMVGVFERNSLDPTKRSFVEVETVSKLVLRAYRQSDDDVYRSRCLDLVDRLVALEVYGISKELEAFER